VAVLLVVVDDEHLPAESVLVQGHFSTVQEKAGFVQASVFAPRADTLI
jgi:hypothetical protein